MPGPGPIKEFRKKEPKVIKDSVKKAFLKTKTGSYLISDEVDRIKKQGGSPSETTTEKVYTKAIKNVERYLGGGAELRGGGRAVMKKGGKV